MQLVSSVSANPSSYYSTQLEIYKSEDETWWVKDDTGFLVFGAPDRALAVGMAKQICGTAHIMAGPCTIDKKIVLFSPTKVRTCPWCNWDSQSHNYTEGV